MWGFKIKKKEEGCQCLNLQKRGVYVFFSFFRLMFDARIEIPTNSYHTRQDLFRRKVSY